MIAILLGSFFLLFPTKYVNHIEEYSKKFNVPKYLVASVINIESGYDKNAISSAGAIGLMQLLPTTAYEIADKLDIDNFAKSDLYDEITNIKFGCYYLSYLLEYYDQNIINALCAYNWGMTNVNKCLNDGNILDDGTIDNIPIKETSEYIKKYKMNKFIYKCVYGF